MVSAVTHVKGDYLPPPRLVCGFLIALSISKVMLELCRFVLRWFLPRVIKWKLGATEMFDIFIWFLPQLIF